MDSFIPCLSIIVGVGIKETTSGVGVIRDARRLRIARAVWLGGLFP